MSVDILETLVEISGYIAKNHVINLHALISYCAKNDRRDWLTYISQKPFMIYTLLTEETERQTRIRSGNEIPGDFDREKL